MYPNPLYTSLPAPMYIYAQCLFCFLFLSIISTAYHLLSGSRAARLPLHWLIDRYTYIHLFSSRLGAHALVTVWFSVTMLVLSPTVHDLVTTYCLLSSIWNAMKTFSDSDKWQDCCTILNVVLCITEVKEVCCILTLFSFNIIPHCYKW